MLRHTKYIKRPVSLKNELPYNGEFVIDVMLDGEVIETIDTIYNGLKWARRAAVAKIREIENPDVYIRVKKINDASVIDFVCKSRLSVKAYKGEDMEVDDGRN